MLKTERWMASPKRRSRNEIFPFYAGFAESFVEEIISNCKNTSLLVDPWNGSGTTTTVGSRLGYPAIGFDINPAMLLIAKANLASRTDAYRARREFRSFLPSGLSTPQSVDVLNDWFKPSTSARIRSIATTILGTDAPSRTTLQWLPYHRAVLMVALFNTCKNIARSLATSNPTWLRRAEPSEGGIQVRRTTLLDQFTGEIDRLTAVLRQRDFKRLRTPALMLADSRCLPLASSVADLIVTSPPYCTRIDYAVATALELAIAVPSKPSRRRALRENSLGSTAVSKATPEVDPLWGSTCRRLLRAIYRHSSRASAGYYYKTHVAYFHGLFQSLNELRRILKRNAQAVVVVQDSYYKEVHNDLPAILTEMAAAAGLTLSSRSDFPVVRSMAAVNSASRSYRSAHSATESALTLTKR